MRIGSQSDFSNTGSFDSMQGGLPPGSSGRWGQDGMTDEIWELAEALEQRARENEERERLDAPLVLSGPGGDFVTGVRPDDIRWVAAIGFVACVVVIVSLAIVLGLKFLG